MDNSSEIAFLRQTLAETQDALSRANNRIHQLEDAHREIEEYGTGEINAAVDLREKLAQALLEVDHWKQETDHWKRVASPWKVNIL